MNEKGVFYMNQMEKAVEKLSDALLKIAIIEIIRSRKIGRLDDGIVKSMRDEHLTDVTYSNAILENFFLYEYAKRRVEH
jgi:hypothetical protein